MSKEELAPAISSKISEMTMKYWSEEPKNPVLVNGILKSLKVLEIVVVSVSLY